MAQADEVLLVEASAALTACAEREEQVSALFAQARFPEGLVAAETDFKDDIATVAHVGDWRIGIHTGVAGGNYRDCERGNDEAQARAIVALIEAYRGRNDPPR